MTHLNRWARFVLVGLVALAGCAKTSGPPVAPDSAKVDSGAGKAAGGSGESPKQGESPETVAKEVPASVRHSAYYWAGLDVRTPFKMKMVEADGVEQTGDVVNKLESVDGGEAKFSIERSGGLAKMGTDTFVVRKDGIYQIASSLGKLDKESKVLPAEPKAGDEWTEKQSISREGGDTLMVDGTTKIEGTSKVQVDGKTYEALVVSTRGTMTAGSASSKIGIRSWYAKGLGVVKHEITQNSGGKEVKVTLALVSK